MKPTVLILAETKVNQGVLGVALDILKAPTWASIYPKDGEELVEFAGRLCYHAFNDKENKNITSLRKKGYIENLLKQGHGSVLEHSTVSILFLNVSRVMTHELVRHRHLSISQLSGRYVRYDEVKTNHPSTDDPRIRKVFDEVDAFINKKHAELTSLFDWDSLPFSEKKKLTSLIRGINPADEVTHILVTSNLRGWRNVFTQRLTAHADARIFEAMEMAFSQMKAKYPEVFSDMRLDPKTKELLTEHGRV